MFLCKKSKFDITNKNLYLALLIFNVGEMPEVFLIPAKAWEVPNEIFVDRTYDEPGQTSKPEWGINLSKKNHSSLENFKFEKIINVFL